MQPDEIKQRLSARRPHSDDQNQVELQAAWKAAQGDPSLRDWIAREEAFDEAVAKALEEGVEVPPGLRESLLQIGQSAGTEPVHKFRQFCRRLLPRRRFAIPALAMLAACLALAATLLVLSRPDTNGDDIDDLYEELSEHYVELGETVGGPGNNGAHPEAEMPEALAERLVPMRKVGGGTLHWNGQPIRFVRMKEKGTGALYNLYIVSSKMVAGSGKKLRKLPEKYSKTLAVSSWKDERHLYLLISTRK